MIAYLIRFCLYAVVATILTLSYAGITRAASALEASRDDNAGGLHIIGFAADKRLGPEAQVIVYNSGDNRRAITRTEAGRQIRLASGKYDVELVYTDDFGIKRSKRAYGIEIEPGRTHLQRIEFQNGMLELNLSPDGTQTSNNEVVATIYSSASGTRPIIQGTLNSELVILEGTYDVKIETQHRARAQVMWIKNVVVKPTQRTILVVDFNKDSSWLTVAVQGTTVLPGVVVKAFEFGKTNEPVAISEPGKYYQVSPGKYDIKVEVGKGNGAYEYWKRNIEVVSGKTNYADITLPVGTVKVNAFTVGGEQIPGTECTVFVYAPGDTSQSLLNMNCAETFALHEGTYDLRVEYTNAQDDPSDWIRGVRVMPGEHQMLRAEFKATGITTVVNAGGEEIPGNLMQVFYYRYGNDTEPAGIILAEAPAILESGWYRVKVVYTGEPLPFEEWAGTIYAESGKPLTLNYKLKGGYVLFSSTGGTITGTAIGSANIPVNIGEKILLPKGFYTFRTSNGEVKLIEVGGSLKVF